MQVLSYAKDPNLKDDLVFNDANLTWLDVTSAAKAGDK